MLNQFAVEIPTLPVDQCHSHLIQYLKECWDILSYRRAAEKGPAKYLGCIWYIRKRFCKSTSFFFSSVSSGIKFYLEGKLLKNQFTCLQWRKEKGKNKIKIWDASLDRQPKIQSSSVEETIQENYGADQQRLQILDLHFDKFPTPATVACWKKRFKTEVCTCSQFPTEAMQWIKEVEMVDSVDDLRSSSSITSYSNDARIASALNKIIQFFTSKEESVWRNKRPRSRTVSFVAGRLLTWSTNTSGSLEPMILSRTMPTYLLSVSVYEMMIFRNSIQSGDGILLSVTKILVDDILEGLYKLRIRESEKLKTVLELYDLEIAQKKLGPDYHRLKKTRVKRSIEQDIRNKNFGARNGIF